MAAAKPTIFDLLRANEPLVMPGCWDAVSARLAEKAGLRTAFLSGYCLSATQLGEPDFGLLTETQMAEAATRVCAAVGIPIIVDMDTGYGNAFNVERTVHDYIRAGAAGAFIEDQVWPKRCGHMQGKRVVPLEEYLPKLKAALKARGSAPFHVTARTDARAAVGLDEAIGRAKIFADAGADAVFVEAPESVEEMDRIRAEVPAKVTLVANMVEKGKTPLRSAQELHRAGYQIVALPLSGLLASVRAIQDVFAAIRRDGGSGAAQDRMLAFGEMNALVGLEEKYRREKEWLG